MIKARVTRHEYENSKPKIRHASTNAHREIDTNPAHFAESSPSALGLTRNGYVTWNVSQNAAKWVLAMVAVVAPKIPALAQ